MSNPDSPRDSLKALPYADLQQCMHCGMCLPTCPTYDATLEEKSGPRGRISLMRAIADGKIGATKAFADEMYFCLGCLACETACPAGVQYAHLFEVARAEAEKSETLAHPVRSTIRTVVLKGLFTRPRLLRLVGRSLRLWQASGAQALFRRLGLDRLLPKKYRDLEKQTPVAQAKFSHDLIAPVETPRERRRRVGLLTGCVQDIVFSDVNRDTADVLLANGCEVVTPPVQPCCGSLHAHNGEPETARALARRLIDQFDLDSLDAVVTNAAGCGSHLKTYGRLLADDPAYAAKAARWSAKLKDVHEFLAGIGLRKPEGGCAGKVTYHEACHLCHGQKITQQPREVLRAIPGLELAELAESTWCCGSAGIYNITQPEMAATLRERKIGHVRETGAPVVATANPGCHLQLQSGAAKAGLGIEVAHPMTLLARAYRAERGMGRQDPERLP